MSTTTPSTALKIPKRRNTLSSARGYYHCSHDSPCAWYNHTPSHSSMSEQAEGTRAAAPNPVEVSAVATSIARPGHEPALIAQPSTFLLPRAQNRAMQEKPLTALDRDQQNGLVSWPVLPTRAVKSALRGHDKITTWGKPKSW